MSIDETVCLATPQMAVETVSVSDGDGGDTAGPCQCATTAVTHRIGSGNIPELQDNALQGADIMDYGIVDGVNAV